MASRSVAMDAAMNESNQGHDPIERSPQVNELTAVAEDDAMREGGHGDDLIEPRAKLNELTETQLAEFEAHYDGSEPEGISSLQKRTSPDELSASRSPMDEATEIHEPAVRPAKVNELTAMHLSSFERQYDEDDRIGFEMSAETYEWSPAEAEAVWQWIGSARGTEGRRS
ncbi:MAG: hypothetical protein M3176_19720 [Chloroflexota bacterium]|nr:hypothetical protein [Chloroflexota bacterium]